MRVETIGFVPVRLNTDAQREWISISEIGLLYEDAKYKANRSDELNPRWGLDNPVQRISKCKIQTEEI
jgi:hypothetical protein